MDNMEKLNLGYVVVLLITYFISTVPLLVGSTCHFPEDFHGTWYQKGLGQIKISKDSITRKGVCNRHLEHRKHMYIIQDKENHCYRCMVLTKWHENVLQYKESYCAQSPSRKATLCSQIHGGALLFTLIREPAKPIPCFFGGSYMFGYTNGSGLCNKPFSSLTECANDYQYRFSFKQCPDVHDTHTASYNFKCLAQWESGGNYMIGQFEGHGIHEKMYRCFLFDNYQPVMKMAMSAEASCMGLVSIQESPIYLELTRDIKKFPSPRCKFPDWLTQHTKWHDLSARFVYHINNDKNTIKISFREHHKAHGETKDIIRCYNIDRVTTTVRLFQAISFTTSGCKSHFQCIRIFQRHKNIVGFHRGRMVRSEINACADENFNGALKQLILPAKLKGSDCPFDGRYDVEITSSNFPACRSTFVSGCDASDHLRVELASCPSTLSVANLRCLSTWTQKNTTYVVARKAGGNKMANCFSFKRKKGQHGIQFSLDPDCNMGAPLIMDQNVEYTLRKNVGSCKGDTKLLPEKTGENGFDDRQSAGKISIDSSDAGAATHLHVSMATLLFALLLLILCRQ